MGIRDAMAAVPAKPILVAAVIITVGAAAWNMWSVHKVCTGRAALTKSLHDWSQAALTGGKPVRLDQATGFEWQHVRFLENAPNQAATVDCPMGWHWSNDERETLAKAGNLTQIGFFRNKHLIEMADFDGRWARFKAGTEAIPRDAAIFSGSTSSKTLTLATP